MRCWESAEAAGISDAALVSSRISTEIRGDSGLVRSAKQYSEGQRAFSSFQMTFFALSYGMKKGKKQKKKMRNNPEDSSVGRCEMCKRKGQSLSEHHLIPRAVHTKKRFKRRFSKEEMRTRKADLCRLCHKRGLHVLIPDNKELADKFNTVELLMADERIRRHVEWVKKQK